jgi:hypothetical protein
VRVEIVFNVFHWVTLVLYIGSLTNLATWFPCGRGRTLFILGSLGQRSRYDPVVKNSIYSNIDLWPNDPKINRILPLPRAIMWSSVVKIQYTELKLCGNDPVVKNYHCYYKYNCWQQGRFRTISLVLYIGSLPNLATWFPCGSGRTLFILGSLGQRSRSPLL